VEKRIKTTDASLEVETSMVMIVRVGSFKFEQEEGRPWINIYLEGTTQENDSFIEEITTDETLGIVDFEDLKRFALNWIFNNVEIIKKI